MFSFKNLGTVILFLVSKTALATPLSLYPETHWFEVYRNGSLVGKHETKFKAENQKLHVTSKMQLNIKFLGLTFYEFDYLAEEKWENNEILSLRVAVNDDGEKLNISADKTEQGLYIQNGSEIYTYPSTLITTNHWRAEVIKSKSVLNTLTGNVNTVEVEDMGWENISVSQGEMSAKRYDYTGDLKDTSVWYDEKGRWVKLAFKARDGSDIEYLCQTCIPTETEITVEPDA